MILLFFLFWNGANLSEFHLNSDLKTSEWAYQWKMSFNPDISKQAQEVIFSIKAFHLAVFFNIIPVARYVLEWEAKLWLLYNKSQKIAKTNKVFDDVKRLHNVLSCKLLVIFKCFIRPNLDYGDFIYEQPNNDWFCNRMESVQYNTALVITGVIRETSETILYNKLGLESLRSRQWFI